MKLQRVLLGILIYQLMTSASTFAANPVPLPVKKKFTITSAAPLEKLWSTLTEKEKNLAFYLQRAARAGRELLFIQSHRHSLTIKNTLEEALNSKNLDTTRAFFGTTERGSEAFKELLTYLAQFEDQGGPYATSNRKYVLQKVTPSEVTHLFKTYHPSSNSQAPNALDEKTLSEITRLLTDSTYEVLHRPEDPNGADLVDSGGNIYQSGLTGKEVQEAISKGLKVDLNCQVVKDMKSGQPVCQKMTTASPAPIGTALGNVVKELKSALPYATSDHQKKEIEYLIQYFTHGDQEDFRKASIEWVLDRTDSKIDFMMGFIEVYDDYKGNVGSWESYVQIVDPETTRVSQLLAKNAQYFEDKMPYGQWKKTFPKDYSPPALMVYYFQEIAGMRSGGYNLPNFDDIRRDVGAKNVIRLPLPGEAENPEKKAILTELYETFGPAGRAEYLTQRYLKQRQVLVLLHEIIGHGSGLYDTTKYAEKEDPISALGSSGSTLEEQRADLAALVFAADPKLINVGIYKTAEEALQIRNAMYDLYLVDFMRLISRERSFAESHMRGHWLLIKLLLEKGAIAWTQTQPQMQNSGIKNLVVKDYEAFWKVSSDLLSELQAIKANRESAKLEKLLSEKAPLDEISSSWAQEIIQRGENLKVNAGSFEQSWNIGADHKFFLLSDMTIEGVTQGWSKIRYQD